MKKQQFKVGDTVEVINDKDAIKIFPEFKLGARFIIRSIGEKDFHKDGGGLRLEGIIFWRDNDGYEQCFSRKRFKLVTI
jgi:hypothetical protein